MQLQPIIPIPQLLLLPHTLPDLPPLKPETKPVTYRTLNHNYSLRDYKDHYSTRISGLLDLLDITSELGSRYEIMSEIEYLTKRKEKMDYIEGLDCAVTD